MFEALRHLDRGKLFGLLFVLLLHGAGLYGLWSYRIIPTPDEAITLMVNLINPPPPEQPKPEPPKPEPPKPPKPRPIEPPKEHLHLAVETPVILPDEPVTYVPPEPVVEAPPPPPLPVQPVMLSGELAVSCPERSPPNYPARSRRFNEQGRVLLRVELGEDGRISGVAVKTSSGFTSLDEAAVSAVKTWRCKPAIQNGVAVRAVALQPFAFILEGR